MKRGGKMFLNNIRPKKWWIIFGVVVLLAVFAVYYYLTNWRINADSTVISGSVLPTTIDLTKSESMKLAFTISRTTNRKQYIYRVRVRIDDLNRQPVKTVYSSGTKTLGPGSYDSVKIPSLVWSGLNDSNQVVTPGNYWAVFEAQRCPYCTIERSVRQITVAKSSLPSITVTPDPATFDPSAQSVSVGYNIDLAGSYKIAVADSTGNIVRVIEDYADNTVGAKTKSWDGKDSAGKAVVDGSYNIVLSQNMTYGAIERGKASVSAKKSEVVPTPVATTYGTGIGSESLANLQIGHYSGSQISYRFKAAKTGSITGALIFLKIDMGSCSQESYDALRCYYHGDGGKVLLEVKADDGTASHLPTGSALTSSLVSDPRATSWRTFQFDNAITLTAGSIYHMVFTNPAADPVNNFVSIDDLGAPGTTPVQPSYSDSDMAVLYKTGTGTLAIKRNHTPIFSLNYSDGSHQGIGYIDIPSAGHLTVTGTTKARESFTVSGGDRSVSQLSIRANGSGTLKLRLESSDGTLIEEGQATGTSSFGWLTYTFRSAQTLRNGQSYNAVFNATSGSLTLYSLQEGIQYGFDSSTVFSDGVAEKTSGSTWSAMRSYDWQFYLK